MLLTNLVLAAAAAAQAAAPAAAPQIIVQPAVPVAVIAPPAPADTAQPAPSTAAPTVVAPVAPVPTPIIAPTPVTPAPPPSGVVLWRSIENGMPVAKLRALYPQGRSVAYKADRTVLTDVSVVEGCEAKVNVMHQNGFVHEIVMRGEGSLAGRCSLKIITALSGKYGQPLEKDKVRGSLLAREGKNYVWMRGGITLQLKRYTNGPLGGGGLFAASWELRYSANATNIDL